MNEKKHEVAIAIHPYLPTYAEKPAASYMQKELDDPSYSRSVGVTILDIDTRAQRPLYVQPKEVIISPPRAERQIHDKHSYDFISPSQLTELLTSGDLKHTAITLMGGEAWKPGCHQGSYKDIVAWFYQLSTLEELTIMIPFEGIFTSGGVALGSDTPYYIKERLKKSYHDDRLSEMEMDETGIVVVFRK